MPFFREKKYIFKVTREKEKKWDIIILKTRKEKNK